MDRGLCLEASAHKLFFEPRRSTERSRALVWILAMCPLPSRYIKKRL